MRTRRFKRALLGLAAILLLGVGLVSLPAAVPLVSAVEQGLAYWQLQGQLDEAIQLLTTHQPVADYLAKFYPEWHGYAYPIDEAGDVWEVNLFAGPEGSGDEEWIGYGRVNITSDEVLEYYVPRKLTADEEAAEGALVQDLVTADPEMLALLADPSEWYPGRYYDPYEPAWYVYFYKGLDSWAARVGIDLTTGEPVFFIQAIYDPDALTEEDELEWARNQAIELSYEAPGLWEALDGIDNWRTFVENQGGTQWSVEYVANDEELFYVLVDIGTWEILETVP